ncbi:4716_t:CDS:2 [Entrophospora sp. SA101]|nr:4716_t:CDS:2 [Entrophospora sp. SA101]
MDKVESQDLDLHGNDVSTISDDSVDREDKRILDSMSGLLININNIIGVGIYSTPGIVWEETRSVGLSLILWILGGFISLFGSLVYAELGLRYIVYAFSNHDCIESSLHPKSYLTGWEFWRIRLISLASVTFVTLYHMYSNRLANNINKCLTIIKTCTLIAVSLIGLIKLNSSINKDNWNHLFDETQLTPHSLALAMIDSIDELKAPENKLMNSNRYSVIIVDIFTNIAYISVVPRELVIRPEQNPNEVIAGQFAMIVGGEIFGRILAFLISISALGVMAVLIWSGSRVIVAAAKHNYIPVFSHLLKQWHPTYNTPVYALGAQKLDGDGYNLYKVSTPLIYMFIMAGVFIVTAPFFTPDTQYYSENYNNSISNTTLPLTTSDLNCPLNTKDTYPYYIPYLVSIMVIFIGIICWYFDGVYRRFQMNRDFCSNNDRRDRRNDGQEDKDLQQQQQDNDRIDVDEIRIPTK